MKMSDYLGGKFLRKEDVDFNGIDLTIHRVTDEQVGQEMDTKPVLAFREHGQKPLVLNKVNINTLIAMFKTDESDKWTGRVVNVWHDPSVNFNGNRGGLRIRPPQHLRDPMQAQAAAYAKQQVADHNSRQQEMKFDDDVNF